MADTNFNFATLLRERGNKDLDPLFDVIDEILAIPDEGLTTETAEIIGNMIKASITENVRTQLTNQLLEGFREEAVSPTEARERMEGTKADINGSIEELTESPFKRQIIASLFDAIFNVLDEALKIYCGPDITLPIKLEPRATCPTYAHETDACADLYALDNMTIPAHSISNQVKTGVHIALPEKWMAMIFPRSSIGAKTGLRLSNNAGIIDSEYRGELIVLYDNISDSDYEIKAGDRIAQMMVMPSYRFKANVVDILPASDRGEGGLGSTGK